MTFPPTAGPRGGSPQAGQNRRPSPLWLTLLIVGALLGAFVIATQIYTEVQWYDQLGALSVFTTEWFTRGVLFLATAIVMAGGVWASLHFAYRNRPVYAPTTPQQENLDRYREAIEPLRKVAMFAVPAVLGLFAGLSASTQWQTVQLWLNRVPFGESDPQFGRDVGFYVFELPFYQFLIDTLGFVALIALIASVVMHYLYGGIRTGEGRGFSLTKGAQVQIGVLVAVLVIVQGLRMWFQRYAILTDSTGIVAGATYTDVNARIPALTIVAIAAGIVALLFIAAAATGRWRFPVVATGVLVVLSLVALLAYPYGIEQFRVQPSQQSMEREYIERNIEATRTAYGIDDVEVSPYQPTAAGEPGALREDAVTAASIRLLDPNLVSDSFRQLQQIRQYYGFPEQLDVDRYEINGEVQDTVIAVRELDQSGLDSATWYNQRIVYTHGFGVVAAYGNRRADDGRPVFSEAGIPPVGELGEYEPRIYFGERSPLYSIVGAPDGAPPLELDYPSDGDAQEAMAEVEVTQDGEPVQAVPEVDEDADIDESTGQVNYTYTGDGGPSVGSFFNRLAYAIKFQDEEIVLSDAINEESQILYNRNPRDRVEAVAPFLTLDGDPYPAVVDGRVKWIVDAYTTSSEYPYSRPEALDSITEDSNTQQGAVPLPTDRINYIRNSVKATVDAYDGSVDLYAWDEEDPVLQAWRQVFPGIIQDVSEMSGDLMSHVRYPEDLFKVQRSLLTQYHVTNADAFYSGQDFWTLPNDPTMSQQNAVAQPPYFLTLQMPNQDEPSFSLTSSFIPRRSAEGQTRNVLTGFLAASADAGNEPGQPSEEYGKLRLLQLPRNTSVPGPGQAQNNFNAEPSIQESLNLLRQGESDVQNGNMLTLPVAGGLLYVQPVYVRSAGETSYPVLQRVLVAFGEEIGFAPTLDEALDQVFGGDSGAQAGDAGSGGEQPEEASGEDEGTEEGAGTEDEAAAEAPASGGDDLTQALEDARQAIQDSEQALEEGDFAAYGEAQERLKDAVERAARAEAAAEGE
ncbi:UPF0182 family protein [Sediminivirga luteola]|uniref:UPF0182 family membrane protein n=1 Tax=Sediminivirga luteola TaxID=1774748 RepID=UPI001F5899EE|nr:UPF0182 family protein [Sediminivirga luteola]MCI2265673.1 UPF0182 family protein [Sediminivirga luteola]